QRRQHRRRCAGQRLCRRWRQPAHPGVRQQRHVQDRDQECRQRAGHLHHAGRQPGDLRVEFESAERSRFCRRDLQDAPRWHHRRQVRPGGQAAQGVRHGQRDRLPHREHPLRRRSRQLQSPEADAALDTTIDRKMAAMRILPWLGVIGAVGMSIGAPVRAPVTVPMSQYDYGRTGANLQESTLNPSNVDATHFGKLFSRRVDDSIYALPLIVPDLEIAGRRHNVLFIASMGNTVYAFDADDPAQSDPLWSRNIGAPAAGDSWIGPVHHGILGTPFIDVPTGTLYAVALVSKGNDYNLWLNALDVSNGNPKYNSPQLLSFPFAGSEGTLTNVRGALQRAGLLMVDDVLYIAFANIVPDPNDQHWAQEGFVQTFNARDLKQRFAVFQTTPSGRKGGVWQAGRGIAADGEGNIYLSTAGGSYDGVSNFGSSTLKFTGRSLKLADW